MTGFAITYFLLHLFIAPFKPYYLYPSRAPYFPTLVVSSEPSNSKTVELVSAVQLQPELSYSAIVYVQSFEVRSV
jgi:hypothetical protein